jgi:fermentation-respiration switch protein FrsA (DUF1100 family)
MDVKSTRDIHLAVRAGRDVPGGRQIAVELDTHPERVPGLLLLPDALGPVPAALLLHGFTSRKERMADSIGKALLRRGVASLAIDLPLHGSREGSFDDVSLRNPMQVVGKWRLAVSEAREALGYLAELPQIDAGRLAIIGYSLGSFLGVTIAAAEPRVRAVVLVAGGDYPETTPFASLIRTVADPLRAVRKLAGRPLLMVNGRFDRTVRPAQAERLFAAASEPKEMRWYQGGHWPGAAEIDAVAEWTKRAIRDARRGVRDAG